MEKESLLKDIKSEVNIVNYTSQNPQTGQPLAKETARFTTFQLTPANTWSYCVEKTQNMLRNAGMGNGQEASGWYHFHKVASSGRELYSSPMDMQQVYYQTGVPEMRGGCYPAPDPRAYPQVPSPAGYSELRPPSQVVNQRFIQCVNHFAPGSRSMPCLLQPSYYGYEYGGPVQGGSETVLPRVDPCEMARPPRYLQHHDWNHIRAGQEQVCYRQPWDYPEQMAQVYAPMRYQEQSRKGKAFDNQEQKNKDKSGGTDKQSFSYLATDVTREMQGVIAAGGHALADLLDFCKFVQSFLFTPSSLTSQRNQLVREIILSFIHVSSAYVHLGSVLLIAEQTGMVQNELESLKTSFNQWESAATSVVMALRSLIHSLSDIKPVDHKKHQDTEDHVGSFKPETPSSFYPNPDSSFINYGLGENSFRFCNSSRVQNRTDFNLNQQHFEFKRKYQQTNTNTTNTPKDSNATFNNTAINMHKNACFNFKAKSCNQINAQNANNNGNNSGKTRNSEQQVGSSDSSDNDKAKVHDIQNVKKFCFNLLNPEKLKNKGKPQNNQDKQEISPKNTKNIKEDEKQAAISAKDSKEENKMLSECMTRSFKHLNLDTDVPIVSPPSLDTMANRLSYLTQAKQDDWNFGLLNTSGKKTFSSKEKLKITESNQQSLFVDPMLKQKDPAEKPMSSDSEGSTGSRFCRGDTIKDEYCNLTQIQLKHKMLDILGFLLTPDVQSDSATFDEINQVKKNLQESLNRISYLVYTDRYGGVGEMMNAVRNLFNKTRLEFTENQKIIKLADEFESTFLDLFKKEFGCCSIIIQQYIGK